MSWYKTVLHLQGTDPFHAFSKKTSRETCHFLRASWRLWSAFWEINRWFSHSGLQLPLNVTDKFLHKWEQSNNDIWHEHAVSYVRSRIWRRWERSTFCILSYPNLDFSKISSPIFGDLLARKSKTFSAVLNFCSTSSYISEGTATDRRIFKSLWTSSHVLLLHFRHFKIYFLSISWVGSENDLD